MNTITQTIINHSTLDVSLIKITNATRDSFVMGIEAKVNGSGPVPATVSPMTVDMVGPGGLFGRLDLPVIKTSSSGGDVLVKDQKIQILDMKAFEAFVHSLINDEELILQLDNGDCEIKALFLSSKIVYRKNIDLKGMHGPRTVNLKTEANGSGFKNTFEMTNPSPVEIDLGTVKIDILNENGEKIAEQKGEIYLFRGMTTVVFEGKILGGKSGGEGRVIATGVEEDNWHNETITAYDMPLKFTNEFVALCET